MVPRNIPYHNNKEKKLQIRLRASKLASLWRSRQCRSAAVLAVLAGAVLLLYYVTDPNHDMEMHYRETDVHLYYLAKIAITVLIAAAALNVRYLVGRVLE